MEIQSDNYYLVAKGGLEGKADTWIKIKGSITITAENSMPLHIKADNDLEFEGFGNMISLTQNPCEYIDCQNPPVTPPEPPSDIDYHKWIKQADYVTENREFYFDLYKTFIKRVPDGEPKVRLEFPSNCITYGGDKNRIWTKVQLYQKINGNWELIIESKDIEGVLDGEKPLGNNHGCYFMLPESDYNVLIWYEKDNGGGNQDWIKAEVFRQDALSPSAYYDYGNPVFLNEGGVAQYQFSSFGVADKPSGLIKINNVSRR